MDLLPKFEQFKKRQQELEDALAQPDATSDMEKYTKLNKEYSELNPIVSSFTEYADLMKEKEDLNSLLDDSDADDEMKKMAKDELDDILKKIPEKENELQILLLPKDEDDDKNVIVEIRAGTGGDEAALFAGVAFRMYCRYAELQGWKVEIMDESEGTVGGYKEAILQISGNNVYSKMKFESGVHRVQRVPETESQGRVHTSAITVAVLPEAEEVELDIPQNELRIDIFRSSGPGGQSVNTTDSAVRITHIPTGIVATCQDEKSQHKNKDKAMKVLFARILDQKREEIDSARAEDRKNQVGTGDRSARIRTYNYPQSRVTDHRINLTLHSLDSITAGDGLDELIQALIAEDQTRKLASLGEDAA
jgi:peptide chain release factor 1